MNSRIYIGIDPDICASGLAAIEVIERKARTLFVESDDLPRLIKVVSSFCEKNADTIVIVEAGWLNEANWHLRKGMSIQKAAAIGKAVGANHQIGRDIIAMLTDAGCNVHERLPLPKCWSGKDRKITQAEIIQFIRDFPKRSNQEERDAMLLAWCTANLPIRIAK